MLLIWIFLLCLGFKFGKCDMDDLDTREVIDEGKRVEEGSARLDSNEDFDPEFYNFDKIIAGGRAENTKDKQNKNDEKVSGDYEKSLIDVENDKDSEEPKALFNLNELYDPVFYKFDNPVASGKALNIKDEQKKIYEEVTVDDKNALIDVEIRTDKKQHKEKFDYDQFNRGFINEKENSSFSCECGYYKNYEQCVSEIALKIMDPENIIDSLDDMDIMVSECKKRTWLALLEISNPEIDSDSETCVGNIINQRFVISAAHCFCTPSVTGISCIENDQARGKKLPSGHYEWTGGTTGSRIDYDPEKFVTLITAGYSTEPSLEKIKMASYARDFPFASYKVKDIKIHEDYVLGVREQADIALIEVETPIKFIPGKVGPICLPTKDFNDLDQPAFIAGWGMLYEKDMQREVAACFTTGEGPEKFNRCRRRFVHTGSMVVVDESNGCSNEDPPVNMNTACRDFHTAIPQAKSERSVLLLLDGSEVSCYPVLGHGRWCATCRSGAQQGEPGFCDMDEENIDDASFDYSHDTPNDVGHDQAWGYCDDKCFAARSGALASNLKEVSLTVLSKQACIDITYKSNDTNMRTQVDRELCAAKKNTYKSSVYKKEGSSYTMTDTREEISWGGTDSCQGDPGGPLYTLDGDRAVLIGLVNRGKGCTRENSMGIYARISHYLDWIHKHAKGGQCNIEKIKRTRAGKFDIFT